VSLTPEPFADLTEAARAYVERAKKARIESAMTQFHMCKQDEFCQIVESDTGVWSRDWKPRTVDPEIISLTNMISNKMEEAGETVMLRTGLPLWMVSAESLLVSGEARKALRFGIDEWRNVVFLPAVGARRRSKMGTALDYFLYKMELANGARPDGEKWRARMWVATHGRRVTVSGVRDAVKELNRRISLANREMKKAGWDVEIVFRNIELGDLVDAAGEPILENGQQTYHIHSHILVILRRVYSPEDWQELLGWIRKHLCPEGKGLGRADDVRWWKESGQIVNTKELLKYILKPHNLSVLSGVELVQLFKQLFKLHICQALGSFRTFLKDLKPFIVLRPGPACPDWREIRNPNRRKPDDLDLDGTGVTMDDLESVVDLVEDDTWDGLDDIEEQALDEHAPRVLAWKPPAPITSPACFPHLLIRCGEDDVDAYLDAISEKPEIQEFIASMRKGLDRNAFRGDPTKTVRVGGVETTFAALAEEAKASTAKAGKRTCYGPQDGDNWSEQREPQTSPNVQNDRPPDIPKEVWEAFDPVPPFDPPKNP